MQRASPTPAALPAFIRPPTPLPPLLAAAEATLLLFAHWLQILDFLHNNCLAGVRPLLTPSVAAPAFTHTLKAALLVWDGPWREQPLDAVDPTIQRIRTQAAMEAAELLLTFAEPRLLETPQGPRVALSPLFRAQCQRLLGALCKVRGRSRQPMGGTVGYNIAGQPAGSPAAGPRWRHSRARCRRCPSPAAVMP